jgi:hypothetical protein
LAETQDALAEEGLAFLRQTLARPRAIGTASGAAATGMWQEQRDQSTDRIT